MKRWIVLSSLSLLACSGSPTLSVLVLQGDGTPDISTLARLRLIVRTCDSDAPALAQNLPRDGTDKIEGPVVPGTDFYLWLQGWERCNPPCFEEGTGMEGQCTCIPDETPQEQILNYEACTDWLEASSDIRRTLTLAPRANPALCPPSPLPSAECSTP